MDNIEDINAFISDANANANLGALPDKLSDSHKARVDKLWENSPTPPSLKSLVDAAADRKNVDPRTKFGRAVRDYLASKGRAYKLEGQHEKKTPAPKIILTNEHLEYIKNNCETMSSVEMAREIFQNDKLTNFNAETRAVADFLKTLPPSKPVYEDPNSVPQKDYRPPAGFQNLCGAVNRIVNPMPHLDWRNLSPKHKKEMQVLGNYLRTYRFIHLMNSFEKQQDRELFESSFIRYTYDKPDLSEEEVDQYMSLSVDIVISASIQRRAEKLRSLIDECADANDPDKQKFSVSLVDAIEKMQTEYHQCQNRMKALLSDLKGKRSERINKAINDNASILNLVQCWKDEELRKKMIRLAEIRKRKLETDVDNLADMDELKARIFGLTREEALDG